MTGDEPAAPAPADGPARTAPAQRAPRAAEAAPAPIRSDALFAGAKEVQIDHRGSLYRLKQTALGKLILTK